MTALSRIPAEAAGRAHALPGSPGGLHSPEPRLAGYWAAGNNADAGQAATGVLLGPTLLSVHREVKCVCGNGRQSSGEDAGWNTCPAAPCSSANTQEKLG